MWYVLGFAYYANVFARNVAFLRLSDGVYATLPHGRHRDYSLEKLGSLKGVDQRMDSTLIRCKHDMRYTACTRTDYKITDHQCTATPSQILREIRDNGQHICERTCGAHAIALV